MSKKITIFLPVETQMTITPDAFASGLLSYRLNPGSQPVSVSAVTASTPIVVGPLDTSREYTLELASGDATVVKAFAGSPTATSGNEFTDAEKTKLTGIEANATADQTGAEIKAAYEAEADTNAFTDAEKTKLAGVEALADVTDEANVVAALDGATLTSATVAATDKVLVQDADDANNLKTVTAQSIADLAAGGGGGGSGSGWVLLGSQTASASTSLDFTSVIDSTYDQYMIVLDNILGSASSTLGLRTSSNNGSTWDTGSADYDCSVEKQGFASDYFREASVNVDEIKLNGTQSISGDRVSGQIYLLDPNTGSKPSFMWYLFMPIASGHHIHGSGRRDAIVNYNAVQLVTNAGSFTSGTARIYGLTKS